MIRSKKGPDLTEQVGALDQALDLATGRLNDEAIAFGRHVIDKVEGRLRHGTTHTLVTFLGATGGGKSSLTNAVVGDDVATTGVRRPTTSSTLACYWGEDDPQRLLDWLEVVNRHHVADGGARSPSEATDASHNLDGLVLLDVPDHDSVEVANRLEMERIAEHADLLVWVTDTEKYGDKAMHSYLQNLHRHGGVTALVLNKSDQLTPEDVDACREDLASLLAADGLDGTPVLVTSTETGDGLGDLLALLHTTVAERAVMVDRLRADVRAAAHDLLEELGADHGGDTVSKKIGPRLSAELVESSGLAIVTESVTAGHKRDGARRTGWPLTRWIRSLRPHPLRRLHLGPGSGGRASLPEPSGVQRARSEAAVRNAIASATSELAPPWPELIEKAATPEPAMLNDRIDQAISGSVRTLERREPRWWQAINAMQLALAVATLIGAVWLALLAFGAYLRLPEVPTPDYRGIPIPTGLLLGGIVIGLLLALISRRLISIGAARRARSVQADAGRAVDAVADELVMMPLQAELTRRQQLRQLLTLANSGS